MQNKLDQHNFTQHFLSAFPELKHSHAKESKDYADDGKTLGHYMATSLLNPRLEESVDFLHRLAAFMEKVCDSEDDVAVNAIWIELFMPLTDQPDRLKLLWPILGSNTRRNITEAAKKLRREKGLPERSF